MRRWCCSMIVAGCVASALPGCGGSAQVSGTAFFDTRLITVGEILDIRIPFDRQAGIEWEVESYDSLYLGFVARSLQMQTDEKGTLLIQFRAKTPGDTTLTLRRRYTTGSGQSTLRDFKISILAQ